ncbi:nuclear transport factor 2 family protein [Dactylosporangium sp. NPDC005572]|uniref:nuclear transport factor 2 family protein n=1 Tax=Dactylosporangium sp. NPDC005572 TaxID=3156889 RepID=UPI0033A44EF6
MSTADTVADKMELTELVARIARAVDRTDRDAIVACYAEKSFDDHGRFRGSGVEFAEYICNSDFTNASPFLYHLLGQSIWDVEGDEAFGETYFDFYMQSEESSLVRSFGRYLDYCQRIDGKWLLTYRRVVMDYRGTHPSTNAPASAGHFEGTRDRNDPVYKRLRWPEHP